MLSSTHVSPPDYSVGVHWDSVTAIGLWVYAHNPLLNWATVCLDWDRMTHFVVSSPCTPTGPRAWMRLVEMPTWTRRQCARRVEEDDRLEVGTSPQEGRQSNDGDLTAFSSSCCLDHWAIHCRGIWGWLELVAVLLNPPNVEILGDAVGVNVQAGQRSAAETKNQFSWEVLHFTSRHQCPNASEGHRGGNGLLAYLNSPLSISTAHSNG